ncbi:hypothetical protein ACSFA0_25250 [Variovorax sp. LT1P1]|uniref:hypothetical protein n=1 Tax=Variovorax sp. LT1P1 TaxID=3443730 RepID=UPI003F481418
MVREKAFDQSIGWLDSMLDAGWFNVPDTVCCPAKPSGMMADVALYCADALPNIAALAGVCDAAITEEDGAWVPASIAAVPGFEPLLLRIATRFFSSFSQRKAEGTAAGLGTRQWDENEEWLAQKTRTDTAQVLLQLAAAVNSARGIAVVLEACPEAISMYSSAALWGAAAPKGVLPRVNAGLTAIQFSSHAALDELVRWGWSAAHPAAAYPKGYAIEHRGDGRKNPLKNTAMLAEVLSYGAIQCTPVMLDRVLGMIREGGSFRPLDAGPLFSIADSVLARDPANSNVEMFVDVFRMAGVFDMDLGRSVRSAATFGRIEVLQGLRGPFPWAQLLDVDDHLIVKLLASNSLEASPERYETVIVYLMDRVEEEGMGHLLHGPWAECREEIVRWAFHHHLYRVIGRLINGGLTPEETFTKGMSVLEHARIHGNAVVIDMILSLRARSRAQQVLDLIATAESTEMQTGFGVATDFGKNAPV